MIILDLLEIFVEERLLVAVCHQCSQFGHVQKYCAEQNEVKCPRCSGSHVLGECDSSSKCCPNCTRYNNKHNELHATNGSDCFLYRRHIEIERRKIKYSDGV
mgnify:CR=1 FL=1